jgi:hypothetical protein
VKPASPYIRKLKQLYSDKKESFEWVKVHDLPDFVRFNHKRHTLKGVACEHCHGDVKNMVVMRQDQPMTMGWCLDCHRGLTAPANVLGPNGAIPAGGLAPIDCSTCHH